MKTKMEPWTWKELIRIQVYYMETVSRDIVYKDGVLGALAISVAKWHPENPNRGGGFCGLCSYYGGPENCQGCPLRTLWGICCPDDDSPFDQWCYDETAGTANRIYNDLVKLYTDEYNKVYGGEDE